MPDDYLHDVFVSYRRADPVRGWVQHHFHPQLAMHLGSLLASDLKEPVFIDQSLETGRPWADELRYHLQRSRCLVCVWSPDYFRRDWCVAEWRSMCEREKVVPVCDGKPPRLVYPVVFNDGDSFPPDARAAQSYTSFARQRLNHHTPVFRQSVRYVEFDELVQVVAEDVAGMVRAAPPWADGWPLADPHPPGPTDFPLDKVRL